MSTTTQDEKTQKEKSKIGERVGVAKQVDQKETCDVTEGNFVIPYI